MPMRFQGREGDLTERARAPDGALVRTVSRSRPDGSPGSVDTIYAGDKRLAGGATNDQRGELS